MTVPRVARLLSAFGLRKSNRRPRIPSAIGSTQQQPLRQEAISTSASSRPANISTASVSTVSISAFSLPRETTRRELPSRAVVRDAWNHNQRNSGSQRASRGGPRVAIDSSLRTPEVESLENWLNHVVTNNTLPAPVRRPGGERRNRGVVDNDILEFALYLDIEKDDVQRFDWLIDNSIHAQLPRDWAEHFDRDGNVYYYNSRTDAAQWEHPLDGYFRNVYKMLKQCNWSGQSQSSMPLKNPQHLGQDCVVCLDRPSCTQIIGCGHTIMCRECADNCMKIRNFCCPLCRGPVWDIAEVDLTEVISSRNTSSTDHSA
mmetsp:Transcript_26283/g.43038  ORF Transcript_26283/g.43038 Transcript_26283/m.43038 type:complete len:316 (+) Transcript_26283:215-1162(+)